VAIINALRSLVPDLPVTVCTEVPRWLLEPALTHPVELRACECDTGLQQLDSLRADLHASLTRAARFHADLAARAAREAAFLRERGVALVLGDIPPLAFAAASAAGLKSAAIGNFTWDWIYEGFPEHTVHHPSLIPAIRGAYAQASVALRLPMHGGFAGMDAIVQDIPLVARRSSHTRGDARRMLRLPAGPLVLLSFGGYGVQGLDTAALARLAGYTLVITNDASGRGLWQVGGRTDRVSQIDMATLRAAGLHYEDLVRAVDVVATKPGYGIVSECIANETAVLYTSRGPFAEYDVLVAGMQRWARSMFIAQTALLAGEWSQTLDRLLAEPAPRERPRLDGADVAARLILEML
jgi:L-arabinokinase